eukprot:831128-Pyramimonas_sp.AAC.1
MTGSCYVKSKRVEIEAVLRATSTGFISRGMPSLTILLDSPRESKGPPMQRSRSIAGSCRIL